MVAFVSGYAASFFYSVLPTDSKAVIRDTLWTILTQRELRHSLEKAAAAKHFHLIEALHGWIDVLSCPLAPQEVLCNLRPAFASSRVTQ